MKNNIFLTLLLIGAVTATKIGNQPSTEPQKHLICYYDSSSYIKEGLGKLIIDDLEPALQFCDYLVYGYAGIERGSFKAISQNGGLDLDIGKGYYRAVTRLKRKYPNLRILLSFGGDKDIETGEDAKDLPNKYLELLESPTGRDTFIQTAYALIKTYGFDGADMAWQFPKNKPKKVHSSIGSFWKSFKKVFTGDSIVDENAEAHKEQFTALLRELKNKLRPEGFLLSTTVLPNVNSSLFFDVPAIINYLDFVNLAAFDFYTPERNPELADLTAPLNEMPDRNPELNVNYQVKYWLRNHCPASKLNLGIASYGRAWKLTEDSGKTANPPVENVANEAPQGPNTLLPGGLYSWPEICSLLPNANNGYEKGAKAPLTRERTYIDQFGIYAYRPADKDGNHGIWISYDDPDTAASKTAYARNMNLGGVALFDLSLDDFRGMCTPEKYPILRAIKYRLTK